MDNIDGIGLARMLGMFGAAISPKDSWQRRLGAASADMAKREQGRRYLAELLASQNGAKEDNQKDAGKTEKSGGDSDSKLAETRSRDLSLPGLNIESDQKEPIQEQDIRINDLVEKLRSQGYGGD